MSQLCYYGSMIEPTAAQTSIIEKVILSFSCKACWRMNGDLNPNFTECWFQVRIYFKTDATLHLTASSTIYYISNIVNLGHSS